VKIISILALFFAFSGCAYRMGPGQRQLPGGAQSIYVKMFENRTQEVGFETEFTNAFTAELARSGVSLVTRQSESELVLVGYIHSISYLGTNSDNMKEKGNTNSLLFTEYTANVTIVLKVLDRAGKEVWQNQFTSSKNYKAPQLTLPGLRTANPLYNQSARRQNIRNVAKILAEEAVSIMTENF
jgi:hypothetical protein